MQQTISIVIPALNEEGNLEGAVQEALTAVADRFAAYEIIIVNDGSRDRTGAIADAFAAANSAIRVIHNGVNKGLGDSILIGMQSAVYDYVGWVAGKNAMDAAAIASLCDAIGKADIVVHYPLQPNFRALWRRVLSQIYSWSINFLFGLRVRYIQGIAILRRDIIKDLELFSHGYSALSEMLIKLINSGYSYVEVGVNTRDRKYGKSSNYKLKGMINIVKSLWLLFIEIKVMRRKHYAYLRTKALQRLS